MQIFQIDISIYRLLLLNYYLPSKKQELSVLAQVPSPVMPTYIFSY